jgi:hypothetical protein
MPELVLLAVVSLTAMGLLVFLFLKIGQTQLSLIRLLTQTNQSLINQVRTTELASLSGLQMSTGQPLGYDDTAYVSTDDREMAAYMESLSNHIGLGDEITEEDLDNIGSVM